MKFFLLSFFLCFSLWSQNDDKFIDYDLACIVYDLQKASFTIPARRLGVLKMCDKQIQVRYSSHLNEPFTVSEASRKLSEKIAFNVDQETYTLKAFFGTKKTRKVVNDGFFVSLTSANNPEKEERVEHLPITSQGWKILYLANRNDFKDKFEVQCRYVKYVNWGAELVSEFANPCDLKFQN